MGFKSEKAFQSETRDLVDEPFHMSGRAFRLCGTIQHASIILFRG